MAASLIRLHPGWRSQSSPSGRSPAGGVASQTPGAPKPVRRSPGRSDMVRAHPVRPRASGGRRSHPKGLRALSPVSRIKAAIYKYPFDKTKVHSHIHPPSKTNVNLTLQTRVLAPSALRAVVLSSEPPAIPCVP